MIIAVLSTEGDGTASPELLAAVADAVNDEEVRPLGDRVTVRSAEIVDYEINATLYLYPGPESEPIINAADASLQKFLKQNDKNQQRRGALRHFSGAPCPWRTARRAECPAGRYPDKRYPCGREYRLQPGKRRNG